MWCKSLKVLNPYETLKEANMTDLKPCEYCHESKSIYEIKSKLHDSMNTEIYITGESLDVDIECHSYGTADIKFRLMFGRNLKEGADNDT